MPADRARAEGERVPSRRYRFQIWQGGMVVAEGSGGDSAAVRREAMHYAMMYAQDGPVQIRSRDYEALFGEARASGAEVGEGGACAAGTLFGAGDA